MRWELKLANGKVVEWDGKDGEDASRRYVDCHRDDAVVAYREANRHGLSVLGDTRRIIG
jgi:hypothetical protein